MDEKGFVKFLRAGKRVPKNLSERTIRSHVPRVKEFEAFLERHGPKGGFSEATEKDVREFISHLAKTKRNTWNNLIPILRYSRYARNEDVELEMLKALDGANVFGAIVAAVKSEVGKRRSDEILADFSVPQIGTPPTEMPRITRRFMDRLESNLDQESCRSILLTGPHAAPPEYYAFEREMLKKSRNVDEYLRKRRQRLEKELTGHMKNNTLWFTQRISPKALAFVKKNPEMTGGVRKGNKIFLTKIPYMMIELLEEKDEKLRRYYYCHCPLARESILNGPRISRDFCYCSAGYEKRPFDVAFGKNTRAEVLQSVLWGDPVCRFSLEIPAEYLNMGRDG